MESFSSFHEIFTAYKLCVGCFESCKFQEHIETCVCFLRLRLRNMLIVFLLPLVGIVSILRRWLYRLRISTSKTNVDPENFLPWQYMSKGGNGLPWDLQRELKEIVVHSLIDHCLAATFLYLVTPIRNCFYVTIQGQEDRPCSVTKHHFHHYSIKITRDWKELWLLFPIFLNITHSL